MPSPYHSLLLSYTHSGRLTILEELQLDSLGYGSISNTSVANTTPTHEHLTSTRFDYVYFATGTPVSVPQIPFLMALRKEYPVDECGGLPCLTQELAWRDDVPLFVVGKLAGLRVGPAAGNLEGARECAERVAWGLRDWLHVSGDSSDVKLENDRKGYIEGLGNRYECLTV